MTPHIHLLTFILFLPFEICWCATEPQSVIINEFSDATLAEDGKLNFTQLATKYGHSAEPYDVTTEDGYILTIFRLGDEHGPSVLLFHGVAESSDDFIIRGKTSLAITLADAGYNVWVGNNRGNKFGRRHVTLDPDIDNEKFFNYSFHEIGCYDLPATIDFILHKTGENSIASIGHSQGTTIFYALGAIRPEYNKKIKVMISMAPISFLNNLHAPLSIVALLGPAINVLAKSIDLNELFRDHDAASDLIRLVCSKGIVSDAVCAYGVLFPLTGFDPANIDSDFLRVIFGHYPAGISRKMLLHYDQIYLRKRFSQYDYGPENNLIRYGTENPPDYNLNAVDMPNALLLGANDQVATVEDAKHLSDCLSNVVHFEVINFTSWSHFDFVWGKDLPKYVYPSIFKLLEEYI